MLPEELVYLLKKYQDELPEPTPEIKEYVERYRADIQNGTYSPEMYADAAKYVCGGPLAMLINAIRQQHSWDIIDDVLDFLATGQQPFGTPPPAQNPHKPDLGTCAVYANTMLPLAVYNGDYHLINIKHIMSAKYDTLQFVMQHDVNYDWSETDDVRQEVLRSVFRSHVQYLREQIGAFEN